ncbi:MAG: hypothetical protein M3Q69_00260 [Acidobacteriota bacterium]|nr:hypothetical protein [Acidobacteriota bacterium]
MTLFSLIALAFGMMASAADAAMPRPAFAAIAIHRGSRPSRRVVRAASRVIATTRSETRRRNALRPLRRMLAPLTGAAAPRAPASRG